MQVYLVEAVKYYKRLLSDVPCRSCQFLLLKAVNCTCQKLSSITRRCSQMYLVEAEKNYYFQLYLLEAVNCTWKKMSSITSSYCLVYLVEAVKNYQKLLSGVDTWQKQSSLPGKSCQVARCLSKRELKLSRQSCTIAALIY